MKAEMLILALQMETHLNSIFAPRLSRINQALGHLCFVLLGVLAAVFYRERMAMVDGAGYTLELLTTEGFMTPHSRWAAGLTQWLPLLGIQFGCSLKTVMILFSVNFVLLYYLEFLFCVYICKKPEWGWAILLLHLLVLNRVYFWPVSEMFQAMVHALVLGAWWSSAQRFRWWQFLPVLALMVLTILFTHPAGRIALVFVAALVLLQGGKWRKRSFWWGGSSNGNRLWVVAVAEASGIGL